ncbi:MAG TPA: hypothetical protein DD653_05230 [Marinilabiliales bacterium]|nr:hypothetical protein [Marinilabiliales bacterium]
MNRLTDTILKQMINNIRGFIVSTGWVLFSLLFLNEGHTQNYSIAEEIQFVNYLITTQQNKEALFLVNKYIDSTKYLLHRDRLLFLKGKLLYNQQQLLESSECFQKVLSHFSLKPALEILSSYELAYSNKVDEGILLLTTVQPSDDKALELLNFEKISFEILSGNTQNYKNYTLSRDTSFNQLSEGQKKLDDLVERYNQFNPKSPVVAGILSAIIPGSGKIYADKLGEGVTTLLGMSILAVIAIENYQKEGINNYKTIGFGSLFTVFYAANIYGSVFSIKVYRDEFKQSFNHALLFTMHIPIRNVYPELFR